MANFVYKRRTALDIRWRLLDYAIGPEADGYESVLSTLGGGIRKSAKRIDRAPDDDILVDVETEYVENMLGTAYVVCQNEITAVVQAALNVTDNAPNKTIFLGRTRKSREWSVRAVGPQFDKKLSKVEVLWQLGNYFKHRDEWGTSTWKGGSKWTLQAINAAGLRPGSSGNLRQGAQALGNTEYTNVATF